MNGLEENSVNPQQFKALFILVSAVLALLVASPALQKVLVYPQTDFFTEVWMLGPGHLAESYPHNVTTGESYKVFLGLANHLGSCSYLSGSGEVSQRNPVWARQL